MVEEIFVGEDVYCDPNLTPIQLPLPTLELHVVVVLREPPCFSPRVSHTNKLLIGSLGEKGN